MTDFELTIEKVKPLLEASGFKEVESYNGFLRLDSKRLTVVIAYNEREKQNLFGVGQHGDWNFLGKDNLSEVFDYEKSLNNFSGFIVDFLNTNGNGILNGDVSKIAELENYERNRAKLYTVKLLDQQNIILADDAWVRKDYSMFIKAIDQIENIEELPASYRFKYKMATDRRERIK